MMAIELRSRLLLVLNVALAWAWSWGTAAAAEPGAEALKFFETKVRPILAENCFKCHGPAKQKGGLRLDSR